MNRFRRSTAVSSRRLPEILSFHLFNSASVSETAAVGRDFSPLNGSADSKTVLPPGMNDSLYMRVKMVKDWNDSVKPVLESWAREGKPLEKANLQGIIKLLKKIKRYKHALEVSLWMSNRRYFYLSPADHANRIELIYKTQGIQQAEKYFKEIPKQVMSYQTYGSLLKCYVDEKSINKAEALFRDMDDLKMLNIYSYNMLMKLYSQTGKYESMDAIFKEMENKGVAPDTYSYNVLMNVYACVPNIEKIEELLVRIKNPEVDRDWHLHALAGRGFMKAGLKDKALAAIRKSEGLIPLKNNHVALGFILTFYADIGDKDEVYRIWDIYKSSGKAANSMYMCMTSALVKVDDIEGAESIIKEWETHFSFYEFRVPTILIAAYCERGSLDKAESLIEKGIAGGRMPYSFTWDYLAGGYFRVNEHAKAVETMKQALSRAPVGWKPSLLNVNAALEYFRLNKDVDGAEEFIKLLQNIGSLTKEVYTQLLRIYFFAERSVSDVLERMRQDGFVLDDETDKELETLRSTHVPS